MRCLILLAVLLAFTVLTTGCGEDNPVDGNDSKPVKGDTLAIAQDARIQSDVPAGTYGMTDRLKVVTVLYNNGLRYDYRSIIKLPALPDSVDVASLLAATLILHYDGSETSRTISVRAFEASETVWYEHSICWNNAPTPEGQPYTSSKVSGNQLRIDVLAVYNDWKPDCGIILTSDDGSEQRFHSRESSVSTLRPSVVYRYR